MAIRKCHKLNLIFVFSVIALFYFLGFPHSASQKEPTTYSAFDEKHAESESHQELAVITTPSPQSEFDDDDQDSWFEEVPTAESVNEEVLTLEEDSDAFLAEELRERAKQEFLDNQQAKVFYDDDGNYRVDVSIPNQSTQDYLISSYPIFYPDEDQLLNGIQGCAIGGFYVDVQSEITWVSEKQGETETHHFICSFDASMNDYLLEKRL